MKKYKVYAAAAMLMIGMGAAGGNEILAQAAEQTASVGTLIEENGNVYYLYPDGTAARDWVAIGNDWFFFSPLDGAMAIDTVINGFMFGKDGKFLGMESAMQPAEETSEKPVIKNRQLKALVEHILSEITRPDMPEEEKIRVCYDYIMNLTTYKRTYDFPAADWQKEWTEEYAFQLLATGEGNCYRYASAFAYLVAGLGYDAKVITGEVVARRGGTTPHGWTEVKVDGSWYIYDPDLQDANGKDYYKKTYANYPSKPLIKMIEWEIGY